ncbi:hypothetical protein [Aestuariibaculum sediminum]|uniref:Uncharacterized protein n=1 Tax=Aestuariibaculum sediminum TaxID=2770637 RepID=A0A8J6Q0P4_9FLAO|nr:hypothetical protein [Aestuariibaculum sediminum]MBD0833363.1 hypothetical protein [Aestuariibaculum sediminum]
MRTLTILLTALLFSGFSYAQDKTSLKLTSDETPTSLKFDVSLQEVIESPVTRFRKELTQTQKEYKKRNPEGENLPLYPNGMLNLLFAEKIATAFNTSGDLSLQEAYFNLDTTDDEFSFGYNFDNRGGEVLNPLCWVASIGAKIKESNGFANIADGGDLFEDNIGVNIKFTKIGSGRIGWGTSGSAKAVSHRENIEANREFLYYTYDEKVKKYGRDELPSIKEKNNAIYTPVNAASETKESMKDKMDEFYEEMIREELKYVDDNKLYTFMFNWWATIEGYLPVGDKKYDITPILSNNEATKVQYYAFNTNASYNFYVQKPSGVSLFGKLIGGVKGNSNIEVNGDKAKSFQSIYVEDGISNLTEPVSAIEVDEYKRFVTTSLKAEVALFFVDNKVGFSPAIEKNFGTYDAVNWKLGVPLSLKNKKGESKVNIELQWKETKTLEGSKHMFGFASSFFFGDLVK